MSSVLSYIPGDSALHRLNPVTKMALVLCLSIASFACSSIPALFAILAVEVALGFFAGIGERTLRLLRGLGFAAVFLFVLQVLFVREGTSIAPGVLGLSLVTDEGVSTAGVVAMRLLDAALPLALVLSATRFDDLANAFVEVLHVPYRYAFAFATALRFVPVLFDEMGAVIEAQTARGVELDTSNPVKKIRLMVPLCAPLLISSVRRADAIALAAERRGFYLRTREGAFKHYPFASIDFGFFALGVFAAVAGAML